MKNSLSFLVLLSLIVCSNAHSQSNTSTKKPTKEETQQWIKEKIGSYAFNSDDGKTKNDYIVLYEGEFITIRNVNSGFGGTFTYITRIPITDIENISFVEKQTSYWLIINVKSKTLGYTFSNSTSTRYELEGRYEILLNKSFKDNDLPNRMKKAFSRLVEIYGGKPFNTKEVF
jgi:hypothetical protein